MASRCEAELNLDIHSNQASHSSALAALNSSSSGGLEELTHIVYDSSPPTEVCSTLQPAPFHSSNFNFDIFTAYEQQQNGLSQFPSLHQPLPSLNTFATSAISLRDTVRQSQDIKNDFSSWQA
ncbi:uncharacterized protein LOC111268560 [Varroa jacobsoni]|uniref:uncharacterized protein LOC111268560 n=1 Tax=Varroa jacobsoni TaxID=62625 RepID=UPI000BF7D15B|nr:uncharacterized protein LOC111268560 [Varroa jacobsoni]